MREIKFRYVYKHTGNGTIMMRHFSLEALEESDRSLLLPPAIYILIDRNLATGLRDKSDREIYEGDIIQAYEEVYSKGLVKSGKPDKVIYSAPGFMPFIIPCHGGELYIDDTEFEVIGNIYENPELIGGRYESEQGVKVR